MAALVALVHLGIVESKVSVGPLDPLVPQDKM